MSKDLVFALKFFIVLLVFLYGFVSSQLKLFPYNVVSPVVSSYGGYFTALLNIEAINNDWRWYEEDGLPKAMAMHDKSKAQQDNIIYTSTADTSAYMLSPEGQELHKWTLDVEALWPDQSHLNALKEVPFDFFTLRDFYAFPDGRIVVIVSLYGTTPWGAGLVMMDKGSNVLWSLQGNYYNDVHVDKAGHIYALRHDITSTSDEGRFDEEVSFNAPYLRDMIVKVDQDGAIVDEYAVIDMLRASEYKNISPYIHDEGKGDYTHMNALEIVEAGIDTPEYMEEGDVLALIRNIDSLVVFNPLTKKVKWASRLPVQMPHDIDLLKNGNFLLYDNQGHLGEGGYSRLVEVTPETMGVQWKYAGSKYKPFESEFWGFQQRLENGNTLTTVPNKGRLFEVDLDGQIVMEYYLPQRKVENGVSYNPVLTSATKIAHSYFSFLASDVPNLSDGVE